jgi:thiamine phosphate synthase YjbQ (UPF0047 family)
LTTVEVPYSVAAALPTLSVFDITNEVSRAVSRAELKSGIAYVGATVPSSLIRVTEREAGFFCDFEELLARLVPLELEQRERLIVMLLGSRVEQIPFSEGNLRLGQWQRILLFGFNGDSRADWDLTLLG